MASRMTQYRPVAPALLDRRDTDRHAVEVRRATARKHGQKPFEAQLIDISAFGCRIVAERPLVAGDRLWLRFPESPPIPATVVWTDQKLAGCRFDSPIDRALTRALSLPAY